jgi:uncharacterized membrane protein (UPF0127 family)
MVPMRRAATVVVLVLLTACSHDQGCPGTTPPGTITFHGGHELTVAIASTEATRAKGLMGVTDLPADHGMAFEFGGASTEASFWMKDTLIPLSVAFIDGDRVVAIREMTPCHADPCRSYSAGAPYTLAVEANAGWFRDHGIEVGDRVDNVSGPNCA